MTQSEIEEISLRQVADYDAHRPGSVFEDPGFRLTVEDAFAIQRQAAALREARGERAAGYKIGCISEAVQKQLGLDRPAFGFLFAPELRASGAALEAGAFACLAIEGEFAVRIAKDVPDPDELREHPERFVHAILPVMELHNNLFRRAAHTAEELIANNALHAGVILPEVELPLVDGGDLLAEQITVLSNGVALGTANAGAIPGGPLASVVRISEHLARYGRYLRKGDLALTGSPLPLYGAAPGDRFEVRTSRYGRVEASIR